MNLMRVCMGSSDFTGDPWYTYNDLDPGVTDTGLRRFSIRKDKAYVLPMLRLALRKNPKLLFFASPWSPPGWMKTSGSVIGGSLLPKYYSVYADYFVRFVRSYQAEEFRFMPSRFRTNLELIARRRRIRNGSIHRVTGPVSRSVTSFGTIWGPPSAGLA
jgi:hypothetical protein